MSPWRWVARRTTPSVTTWCSSTWAFPMNAVARRCSRTSPSSRARVEVTALVGAVGSGKSTCARLSCRLWDASSGTVTVGGVDVSTVDPEVLLGDFSVVFQDVTLFDDT